jgi:Family of unknown function (DUF6496)
MPWDKVMGEFKKGSLHSGKGGKIVKSRKQAIAIMLSEKAKAHEGSYAARKRFAKKKR